MISFGNRNNCCFISSIVELPLFYEPKTILYGSMFGTTEEIYEPVPIEVRQGRDIEIIPGLTKYKVEVTIGNEHAEMVGIALQRFDPNNILNDEFSRIPFFPIYIHSYRTCYLFIESINDLFRCSNMVCSPIGTNQVTSAMEVIRRIDDLISPVGDDMCYDIRYAHLGMNHRLIDFLMQCIGVGANWDDKSKLDQANATLRREYGILDDQIPLPIQFLGNTRCVAQLRPFLNPYGNVPSDIAMATITTVRNNFYEIKQELLNANALPDRVGDIYMTEAEDFSFTGKWLSLIFQNESSDFQFPIRKNTNDVSDVYARECDVYHGFKHSFNRLSQWNDISSCMSSSLMLGNYFESGDLTIQRSWLEDIVVRDAEGRIVKYADMVLLILMCAEGLINQCMIDQISTLCH